MVVVILIPTLLAGPRLVLAKDIERVALYPKRARQEHRKAIFSSVGVREFGRIGIAVQIFYRNQPPHADSVPQMRRPGHEAGKNSSRNAALDSKNITGNRG